MSEREHKGRAMIVACENDEFAAAVIKVLFDNKISILWCIGSIAELEPESDVIILFYGTCCVKSVHFVKWAAVAREFKKKGKPIPFITVVRESLDADIPLLIADGADSIIRYPDGIIDVQSARNFYRLLRPISPLFKVRRKKIGALKSESQ